MDINKLNSIVFASLFSALVGVLPFVGALIYDAFSRGNSIFAFPSLIELSKVYFAVTFNAFLLILIVGAPVYLLFRKFDLANYVSAAIIGGGFTLLIGSFQTPWLFIAVSGFIIGPIFHYFYSRSRNKQNKNKRVGDK